MGWLSGRRRLDALNRVTYASSRALGGASPIRPNLASEPPSRTLRVPIVGRPRPGGLGEKHYSEEGSWNERSTMSAWSVETG